jgi:heat shock protein HslJ
VNRNALIAIAVVCILAVAFIILRQPSGSGQPDSPTAKTISSATAIPTTKPIATATATPTKIPPTATPAKPTTAPATTEPPKPTALPTATANPIQGVLWQWTSVKNQSTGNTQNIPDPASYTISFKADGTTEGKADCNSYKGTYSQQYGFSINITTTTTAYCGEGSLEQEYLQLLRSTAAGGPDGAGGLALETAGGEQRMSFVNGGSAPK